MCPENFGIKKTEGRKPEGSCRSCGKEDGGGRGIKKERVKETLGYTKSEKYDILHISKQEK